MKDEDLKLPNGSACDLNEAEEVGKWARKNQTQHGLLLTIIKFMNI